MCKFTQYFHYSKIFIEMGNTLYTIFLLGLPLLVCIILWHTVKRLIARYRTSDDESAGAGCLNLVIFMCLALVFIGVLVAINNHFVTTITVDRNEKGEITYRSSHRFSVHKGEDADNPTGNRLVNRSDIPVYLYSETYSIMAPLAVTAPTYTIMCAPARPSRSTSASITSSSLLPSMCR